MKERWWHEVLFIKPDKAIEEEVERIFDMDQVPSINIHIRCLYKETKEIKEAHFNKKNWRTWYQNKWWFLNGGTFIWFVSPSLYGHTKICHKTHNPTILFSIWRHYNSCGILHWKWQRLFCHKQQQIHTFIAYFSLCVYVYVS